MRKKMRKKHWMKRKEKTKITKTRIMRTITRKMRWQTEKTMCQTHSPTNLRTILAIISNNRNNYTTQLAKSEHENHHITQSPHLWTETCTL